MTKKVRNPDLRKKVKLTIKIHTRALDEAECLLTCIPLCSKHGAFGSDNNMKRNEREQMTMYYECKECEKVYKKWQNGVWRIMSRLWTDYYRQFNTSK